MSDAKRFGGAHSPGAAQSPPPASRFAGRKAQTFSWRVLGLYLAPTAMLASGFWQFVSGDLGQLLWVFGSWAALMVGAWLTSEGLKAEAAYDERVVAKPPAFPRKLVGAAVIGLAIFAAVAVGAGGGLILGGAFAFAAAAAHIAAFGADPMRAKGGAAVSSAELDRVAEKLDRAEAVVAETVKAAKTLRDRAITGRVDTLAYAARDILKEIQNDPRDLGRARKFLSVHLVGLRDATVKFADARAKGAAEDLRGDYESLLIDLEQSFGKQRERLLADDQTELEVEIEVLRDRLKQEGAL